MTEETASRVVELLESIDGKLDALQRLEVRVDSLHEMMIAMKMDISGFQHEHDEYPGRLETIEATLSDIHLILESVAVPAEIRPEAPPV